MTKKAVPKKKTGKQVAAQMAECLEFYRAELPDHARNHRNTPFGSTADGVVEVLKTV